MEIKLNDGRIVFSIELDWDDYWTDDDKQSDVELEETGVFAIVSIKGGESYGTASYNELSTQYSTQQCCVEYCVEYSDEVKVLEYNIFYTIPNLVENDVISISNWICGLV